MNFACHWRRALKNEFKRQKMELLGPNCRNQKQPMLTRRPTHDRSNNIERCFRPYRSRRPRRSPQVSWWYGNYVPSSDSGNEYTVPKNRRASHSPRDRYYTDSAEDFSKPERDGFEAAAMKGTSLESRLPPRYDELPCDHPVCRDCLARCSPEARSSSARPYPLRRRRLVQGILEEDGANMGRSCFDRLDNDNYCKSPDDDAFKNYRRLENEHYKYGTPYQDTGNSSTTSFRCCHGPNRSRYGFEDHPKRNVFATSPLKKYLHPHTDFPDDYRHPYLSENDSMSRRYGVFGDGRHNGPRDPEAMEHRPSKRRDELNDMYESIGQYPATPDYRSHHPVTCCPDGFHNCNHEANDKYVDQSYSHHRPCHGRNHPCSCRHYLNNVHGNGSWRNASNRSSATSNTCGHSSASEPTEYSDHWPQKANFTKSKKCRQKRREEIHKCQKPFIHREDDRLHPSDKPYGYFTAHSPRSIKGCRCCNRPVPGCAGCGEGGYNGPSCPGYVGMEPRPAGNERLVCHNPDMTRHQVEYRNPSASFSIGDASWGIENSGYIRPKQKHFSSPSPECNRRSRTPGGRRRSRSKSKRIGRDSAEPDSSGRELTDKSQSNSCQMPSRQSDLEGKRSDPFRPAESVLKEVRPKSKPDWLRRHLSLMTECSQERQENAKSRMERIIDKTQTLERTAKNMHVNFSDLQGRLDKVCHFKSSI